MFINTSKLIFISCLIMGTLISISANSWLGAWMGLEINLLSFIPLMSSLKNLLTNESALKYFLVQVMASSILLFSVILSYTYSNYSLNLEIFNQMMINSSLLLKMGAAPFHFWFPSVMESLNWVNCIILMSWQKIAPLMLISYTMNKSLIYLITILSLIIGALGGMNQVNLRTLLSYSSINHLGWILISMTISESLWMTYFMFYIFMSVTIALFFNYFKIYHMNQLYSMNLSPLCKFFMLANMLSLGGLPPFLGFYPKLMVINVLINFKMYFITWIMVMMALITLFFYLRVTFSAFMLMYPSLKWLNLSMNKYFYWNIFFSLISILGFPLILLIYSIL
uniref:NADH-ubiquinone oxidoreductase chain 2 n=1 Tax=Chauliodes pectinicornis TaxID=336004 RepID=A0A8A4HNJ5_CHAPS|nr:NADH dehydrogenase subunit 2 [Chauliodes pectinicornis]